MKPILKLLPIIIFILFCYTGCSKKKDGPSYETTIKFTYNGQQYEGGTVSYIRSNFIFPELIFANFAGLYISRPDIFGGDIEIWGLDQGNIDCAFLRPTGIIVSGPCNNLQTNGGPIDSVRTYWIESGAVSFGYSDCKELTNLIVPGQKDCAITGSFNLTLTNKNHQKIILTNGTFTARIKKYN